MTTSSIGDAKGTAVKGQAMKLSQTQVAILKGLADGDVLEYAGRPLHRFAWVSDNRPNPRRDSVPKLERLGLVEVESREWWGKSS